MTMFGMGTRLDCLKDLSLCEFRFRHVTMEGRHAAGELEGFPSAVPNATAIVRRIWLPGLDAGYDPQGLAVDGGGIYVSTYRSDSLGVRRGPCRVIRIDLETGGPTGYVNVASPCGHAGGLAIGGDGMLYVADTHTLFATPLAQAFDPGARFRQFPLGPGVIGGLAASTPDGIWLGTYEIGPGRLFRFTAATLARLSDGEAP